MNEGGDSAGHSASTEYGNPSRCLEMRLDLLRLPCLIRKSQPIAPHLPGVYVHVSGSASGPSEPHLPDTARLRRPLRTTQETGLNHFSPGWTKLVQSIEPARFTSDRENWTRTTNAEKQENAKTRKKGRGESPQKSDVGDGNTKRATTTATHEKTPTDRETRASQRRDENHWARSGWGSISLTSLGVF